MKSTLDILSTFKQAIDPIVANLIDGKVLLRQSEKGDQKTNVILGILNNPGTYVQQGIVNVNPECLGISEEKPDMQTLKSIVDVLLPMFDDKSISANGITIHCSIDDDKGIFKDQDKENKFFYNIRVNFVTL